MTLFTPFLALAMARPRAFLGDTMYREAPRHQITRWLFWPGVFLLNAMAIGAIAWMAGALYVDLPAQENSRKVLAMIWFFGALVLWRVVQPRWQARLSVTVAFALL